MKRLKVAITGAAGQIGYALLFRVASGAMFGPETEVELQLLELDSVLPSLNGVRMELEDCAFPLLKKVTCTSDPEVAFKDANWCLLIGSVPRKKGMERSDLLGVNGALFKIQGAAINKVAASDVRIFVVGNPCNTNCLIAMKAAPKIPKERFFAMTMLDENRAKTQIALKTNAKVGDVSHFVIWGNHSANQFPDFYHARVGNISVTEKVNDPDWLNDIFVPMIQQRGAAVIAARGQSSAASAANAIIDSVHRLTEDTVGDDFFSTSIISEGDYGIDPGLVFSFPLRTKNGKVEVVKDLDLNEHTRLMVGKVLDELRSEAEIVKGLGYV